jgi:hypothetical protein
MNVCGGPAGRMRGKVALRGRPATREPPPPNNDTKTPARRPLAYLSMK